MRHFFQTHLQGVFKTAQQEDCRSMSSSKKKNVELFDILLFAFDFLLFVDYTICKPYEKEDTYAG
jgi:hypothetical protein